MASGVVSTLLPYALPALGLLLVVSTVPSLLVRLSDMVSVKLARRVRLRRLMRTHADTAGLLTLSERLDAFWFRFHLAGTPIEWIVGGTALVIALSAVSETVFHIWVLDIGMPLDGLFLLAYLVWQSHATTFNKHMAQMSTAFHIVATEFNVHRNVTTALLQAFDRLPSPINLRFQRARKLLTSGAAPTQALEVLGGDLGPPYGKLFASVLTQGLTSSSIDSLLVQIATMTEEWQIQRKQARSMLSAQKLTGLMFNAAFYPAAIMVRATFPQVAEYQASHPLVFVVGVAAVAAGFVMSMLS